MNKIIKIYLILFMNYFLAQVINNTNATANTTTNNSVNNSNSTTTNNSTQNNSIPINNCLSLYDNKCILCDVFNFYNYNKNTNNCEKNYIYYEVSNCEFYLNDYCVKCKNNYMLVNNNCIIYPILHENYYIKNCEYYDAIYGHVYCKKCYDNYVYNSIDNECQKVVTIANCDKYNILNTKCITCDTNYVLSVDKTTCISINNNSNNNTNITNTTSANNIINNTNTYIDDNCYLYLDNNNTCTDCFDTDKSSYYLSNYDNYYQQFYSYLKYDTFLKYFKYDNQTLQLNNELFNNFEYCIKIEIPNCIKINNNKCKKCDKGYSLINNNCTKNPVKSIKKCKYYKKNGECIECESLYYLKDNACIQRTKTINCIEYELNSDNCKSCLIYYKLEAGECKTKTDANIPYCIQTNTDGTTCKLCSEYYYLSNSKCIIRNNITNCTKFLATEDKCTECAEGFVRYNFNCENRKIANCVEYSNNGITCSRCDSNYYLKYLYYCEKRKTLNCASVVVDKDLCSSCITGYQNTNGYCNKISFNNCLDVKDGICSKCQLGYEFDTTIQNCKSKITNCDIFSSDIKCFSCKAGYLLSNNTCNIINNIQYCVEYDNFGNCITCESNKLAINNICEDFPNCSAAFLNFTCKKCINGYYLDNNNICVKIPERCIRYNTNDIFTCLECESGYFVNDNQLCSKVFENNCLNMEKVNDKYVCSLCVSNFTLKFDRSCKAQTVVNCTKENEAGQCVRCVNRYYPSSGSCVDNPNKCITYDNYSTICTICEPGNYKTSMGVCLTLPANCKTADIGGVCEVCNDLFYKDSSNNCLANPINCAIANASGVCQTCADGYYKDASNNCLQITQANCIAYDNTMKCSKCKDKYYVNSLKQCQLLYNEYCLQADQSLICEKCTNNHYLTNENTCLMNTLLQDNYNLSNYCRIYNPNNSNLCDYCVEYYYLSDDQSKCFPIDESYIYNCAYYESLSPKQCKICEQNYYLDTDKLCQLIEKESLIENCNYYSGKGLCSVCINGYLLVNNKCEKVKFDVTNCYFDEFVGYLNAEYCDCEEGYTFNGELKKCEANILNCETQKNGNCEKCLNGYIASETMKECKIIKLVENCLEYDGSGNCLACVGKDNFVWNSNTNKCIKVEKSVAYCKKYNTKKPCALCKSGYRLSNTGCIKCLTENCMLCDSNSNCLICNSKFSMDINNKCIKNNDTESVTLIVKLYLILIIYIFN